MTLEIHYKSGSISILRGVHSSTEVTTEKVMDLLNDGGRFDIVEAVAMTPEEDDKDFDYRGRLAIEAYNRMPVRSYAKVV